MNVLWLLIWIFIQRIAFLLIAGKLLPVMLLPDYIVPTQINLVQTQLNLNHFRTLIVTCLKELCANITSTDYGFMMIHEQEGKFCILEEVTFHFSLDSWLCNWKITVQVYLIDNLFSPMIPSFGMHEWRLAGLCLQKVE